MDIQLKDIFIDDKPESYIPSEELIKALEIAYALKRPLLLSGDPGTGKTDFAKWVAMALSSKGFSKEPLVYNTKSSSVSQDLFYFYDAVSHFRETQAHQERDIVSSENTSVHQSGDDEARITEKNSVEKIQENVITKRKTVDFIELKALGMAFARAIGSKNALENTQFFLSKKLNEGPEGTVVLIDEVDKAPRDFPNDLLNEIEGYEFEIREINKKIKVAKEQRKHLVIILTSNFEKNLPEAFLRRCIYFHIEFPKPGMLVKIVMKRLNLNDDQLKLVGERVEEFLKVRNFELQKKPSTAELIDWIRAIKDEGLLNSFLFASDGKLNKKSPLLPFMPVLLKKREDMQLVMSK